MPKDFWTNFQNFLGEQRIPLFLVELLKKTGYDSALSIQGLNEKNILELEKYLNINLANFNNLFKNTAYESTETFNFLPGHQTLLSSLGGQVTIFLNCGSFKRKTKLTSSLDGELNPIQEEVDLLNDCEQDKLKEVLLSKVSKFNLKNKITNENLNILNISTPLDAIINSSGKIVYKAYFTCHLCKVRIPCIYNSYWQISNLEKHIKSHNKDPNPFLEPNKENAPENQAENSEIQPTKTPITRLDSTAREELNKILETTLFDSIDSSLEREKENDQSIIAGN